MFLQILPALPFLAGALMWAAGHHAFGRGR